MGETAEKATRTRKPRRKRTEEEKQAAAQKRAETKAQAENMRPTVYIQYQDAEADVDALVEAAKADFRTVKKRALIMDLKLYVKPEERTAYYVINGVFSGKVPF